MAGKRILRRIGCFFVVCVLLLVLAVAFLPAILSTGSARRAVLGQVNKRVGGKLTIDNWSVGWFRGVQASGIEFADTKENVIVRVDRVTVPAGIFSLLKPAKDLGHIEILKPQVEISVPAPAAKTAPAGTAVEGKVELGAVSREPAKAGAPVAAMKLLPVDIKCRFDLREGSIIVKCAGSETPLQLSNLNIGVEIASLNKPITFEVSTGFGDIGGGFETKGTAALFSGGVLDPKTVAVDATAKIDSLQLGPVTALAKAFAPVPDIAGVLTAGLDLKMRGMEDLNATAQVAVEKLAMSGGPIGEDKPYFDKLALDLAVGMKGKNLKVEKFRFDSPILDATASGELQLAGGGQSPERSFACNAHANIAAIAADFPHTLKLKPGLSIKRGDVYLDGRAASAGKKQTCDVSLKIQDVLAKLNEREVGLDAPVVLTAKATMDQAGPRLDEFSLKSSFLSASGGGSMEEMSFDISTDLSSAFAEAAKFVDMPAGLKLEGKAGFACKAGMKDKVASVSSADLTVSSLLFEQAGKKLAEKELRVSIEGATADLQQRSADLKSLAVVFSPGKIKVSDVAVNDWSNPVAGVKARLDTDTDLAELMIVLGGFVPLKKGSSVGGRVVADVDIASGGTGQKLNLSANVKASSLSFVQDGKRIFEKELRVSAEGGSADIQKRSAGLKSLAVNFSPGKIKVSDVAVNDWSNLVAGVKASLDADIDLGGLVTVLGGFAALKEGTSVRGRMVVDGDVLSGTDQKIKLAANITDFGMTFPDGRPPVEEKQVALNAAARIEPGPGNAVLESFSLSSSPLGLSGSGSYTGWKGLKNLDAKGELECDLACIAVMAKNMAGLEIDMAGKRAGPFSIKTSLKDTTLGPLLNNTEMSAGLYAERLEFFGVKVGEMKIPLLVQNGVASVKIDTTVNEGKLVLAPAISANAKGDKPVLTLPNDSRVLTKVNVTEGIVDKLLARIHPIFKGLIITNGKLSLEMKNLRVPLDETMQKASEFEGRIMLTDLTLKSSGLLDMVLSLVGEKKEILPGDQNFAFVCKKGRIYPDPLKIDVGEYDIVFSGSVGMDQTLEYFVDIPVTREMVGKDAYELLKGESIRVPIGGTVSKPKLAQDAYQKVLGDLIKKSAARAAERVIEKEAGKLIDGLFR